MNSLPGWLRNALVITGLSVLFYFSFFHQLDKDLVLNFDEARTGVNTLEMYVSHHWLVTTYDGAVEDWNVKPPLLNWVNCASIAVFGVNELGIRIPSACFGVFTCLVLIYFSRTYLGDFRIGLFASLVLCSSQGFNGIHVARTGDFDSMLVFFSLSYTLAFYVFIGSEKRSASTWFVAVVCFILAFFTKSVASFPLLPGMILFTFYRKKQGKLLKYPGFYLGIIVFAGLLFAYYRFRELENGGFTRLVLSEEPGRVFINTEPEFHHPVWYYLNEMTTGRFTPWIFILPTLAYYGLIHPTEALRLFTRYCLILILPMLLLLSFAATKNYQYIAPAYPFAAMILGIGLHSMYKHYFRTEWWKLAKHKNILYCNVGMLLIIAFYKNFDKNMTGKDKYLYSPPYGRYIKEIWKLNPGLKTYTIVFNGYSAHTNFYREALMIEHPDMHVSYGNFNPKNLEYKDTNKVYMTCESDIWKYYKSHYSVMEIMYIKPEGHVFQIDSVNNLRFPPVKVRKKEN